ncbi:hypothetical protein [Streptomyces sp. 6-11-2]|uniref:hypothetical protein n=1 Tax=Streptomyces sp. 6-11-2 TaxID=2585753 RepID=UPI0011724C45|nr:hypothetical protein [Streptomyces sp. 6-11-2]GED90004.1 hypothetical protein TNCT6_70890 [Streptomyces sp. 6-11-2]
MHAVTRRRRLVVLRCRRLVVRRYWRQVVRRYRRLVVLRCRLVVRRYRRLVMLCYRRLWVLWCGRCGADRADDSARGQSRRRCAQGRSPFQPVDHDQACLCEWG